MTIYTAIGTMSGTSMDSIDVALLKTDGESYIEEIASDNLHYPLWFHILLKSAEYTVRQQQGNLQHAATHYPSLLNQFLMNELQLDKTQAMVKKAELTQQFFEHVERELNLNNIIFYSTCLHLLAIKNLLAQARYLPNQIDVIGYHGQTLFHNPSAKITIQIGDGQYLADNLGITVVSDFRSNDVSQGGQGAPFAPIYHQALASRDQLIPCAVINCGGVANVTVVNGETPANLLSFDIGPGNGLIDRFVKQQTQGKQQFDLDGQYGLAGTVDQAILAKLRSHALLNNDGSNFLSLAPPKSLDIADFKLISELNALSLKDGCRTLEAFTADCIASAFGLIQTSKPSWPLPQYLILVGGGNHNPVIRQELEQRLKIDIQLLSAKSIAWDNKAIEAQIFAYLAVRCLQHKPISFPETTGVPLPLCGGRIAIPKSGDSPALLQR